MAPARDRRTGFSRRRQYGVFMGYVLAVAGAVVGLVLLVASTFNPPAFSALRMGVAGGDDAGVDRARHGRIVDLGHPRRDRELFLREAGERRVARRSRANAGVADARADDRV
ncbi:hypothetical protein [Sphingomonas sp. H160509]|uniref:hypothetical protein n=1 Tax=Sphingomonas sp. H160509 TaxID=2955313 RepID=UPI003158C2F3